MLNCLVMSCFLISTYCLINGLMDRFINLPSSLNNQSLHYQMTGRSMSWLNNLFNSSSLLYLCRYSSCLQCVPHPQYLPVDARGALCGGGQSLQQDKQCPPQCRHSLCSCRWAVLSWFQRGAIMFFFNEERQADVAPVATNWTSSVV